MSLHSLKNQIQKLKDKQQADIITPEEAANYDVDPNLLVGKTWNQIADEMAEWVESRDQEE